MEMTLPCAATLDILQGGPGTGSESGCPRAHMWGPVWSAFCDSDCSARKTSAHATNVDVAAGRA
eukprot:3321716-Pyramimonas_sp.AAC.1